MSRLFNISSGRYPDDAVYIGRLPCYGDTRYGNPFYIGVDGTREEVIAKYEEHVLADADLLNDIQTNLAGKDLLCHCVPLPCHGEVLLRLANPPKIEIQPL